MTINKVEFIKSVADISDIPKPGRPEIAFAGRSNSGKSSLINTILNRKKLAKTSSKPGKTRLLNYFNVNDRIYFVDLPGYGFAGVSRKLRYEWKGLIESYLSENRFLKLVLIICDIRRGITEMDLELIEWLDHGGIDTRIILTKSDKLSKSKSINLKNEITEKYSLRSTPVIFSSLKKTGIKDTWRIINQKAAVDHDPKSI
ncbi:ribosome biogenesis GTP-binding protein YihA/YsxC [candidate division KSB1 bacterium]